MFWWSASITLDNNNGVLIDFYPFISLYTLPHTSVSLTGCISNAFFSFEYFDSFDHYAAFRFPLRRREVVSCCLLRSKLLGKVEVVRS